MKKLSVRSRILLIFSISMFCAILVTFFIVRMVSASVMEKTLADYLLSAVNVNAEKIEYLDKDAATEAQKSDAVNLYIEYQDGYLRINDDFLDILNDVESALYTSQGELLYGNNPMSKEMEGEPFTTSKLYVKEIGADRYIIYDRCLVTSGLEDLWIRGIVPLEQQQIQLHQVTKCVLAFLPLLALIIIIASILAAKGILRPLNEMKNTAQKIADADDLDKRIETGSNRDELYALATTYNEMFDRLDRSFAREKQFTSDASHELRTPLAVILTQTEYALSDARSEEEYKSAFKVIERQSRRMKKLVEELLSLVRIGQGEKRFPLEQVDLSRICRQVMEDMSRIGYQGITIEGDIQDGVVIRGNEGLLERLVINLLDNAYKYGNENGHTLLELKQTKKETILSVKDDGIGISKEAQSKIFDRFYQEDSSRGSEKGYGLGLALVNEIARYHGGQMRITSEGKGKGSEFTFSIKRGETGYEVFKDQ
ncbi:MAG: HAMP domain-containing histidine kinase [Eubacterium sp.]|nr:HAMP domain-containing histidine kinase [Eubacterium sp.]